MKKIIREYLEETIQSKKGMRRRIYQLEEEIKEAKKNEKFAIEQMNKYKKDNIKLRRKLKEK